MAQYGTDGKVNEQEYNEIVGNLVIGADRVNKLESGNIYTMFNDHSYAAICPKMHEITVFDTIGHCIAWFFVPSLTPDFDIWVQ